MRLEKKMLVKMIMILGIMLCGTTVYATDTRFTQPAKVAEQPVAKSANTTTSQTITFDEGEYVRITQPIQTDGETTTFERQINVMGEARKGTRITIKVYLSTTEMGNTISKETPVEYKLAAVGATQTFNQLIDLGEGCNTVSITYTHEALANAKGELTLVIKRESEETKEAIKNFRVDNSNVILDKVGK